MALSALMRMPPGRAGELGAEALLRISQAPLSDRHRFLLGECVEAYQDLSAEDHERFRTVLEANATGRLTAVNKTSFDLGHEAGVEEGELRGFRAAVGELLEARFGPVPVDLTAALTAVADLSALKGVLKEAGKAVSLAAFRAAVGV